MNEKSVARLRRWRCLHFTWKIWNRLRIFAAPRFMCSEQSDDKSLTRPCPPRYFWHNSSIDLCKSKFGDHKQCIPISHRTTKQPNKCIQTVCRKWRKDFKCELSRSGLGVNSVSASMRSNFIYWFNFAIQPDVAVCRRCRRRRCSIALFSSAKWYANMK